MSKEKKDKEDIIEVEEVEKVKNSPITEKKHSVWPLNFFRKKDK